jgi:superoxide dismutase, Cu-Zn family
MMTPLNQEDRIMSRSLSHSRTILSLILLAPLALAAACSRQPEPPAQPAAQEPAAAPAPMAEQGATATATLAGREGSGISGVVTFTEGAGGVTIVADVAGVPNPGPHGFHIHETGDCSAADFTSAGGHFNPGGNQHGAPDAADRHAGDLGNIEVGDDGSGHLELTSDRITVSPGANSVVGRAVILHEKADDLVSQPTGAAGGRIACGVITAGGGDMDEAPDHDAGDEGGGEGEAPVS